MKTKMTTLPVTAWISCSPWLAFLLVPLAGFLILPPPTWAATQIQFSQLTFGVVGSQYPSLDAAGTQVAFESSDDLVPGSNPTGTGQIFLMNVDGSNLVQLTQGTNISANAALNASGDKVAFSSFNDLVPGQNTDLNSEIFIINSDGTGLTQLTHSVGGQDVGGPGLLANFFPYLDGLGLQVVFTSVVDLLSSDSDINIEIFVVNADGSGLRQLTDGVGSYSASLDPSGQNVFFITNSQLFTMKIDKTGLTQLTNAPPPGIDQKTSVDGSGTQIVFSAEADLVPGGNTDGNSEIYLFNLTSGGFTQITNTIGGRGCWGPSISTAGEFVAFASDSDLVGSNPSHTDQIFIAKLSYTADTPVSSPSPSPVLVNIGPVGSAVIALTFPQVTGAGTTTVTPVNPSSVGYTLPGSSLAFDITTTAAYPTPVPTPPGIIIAFQVAPPLDASQLTVFHSESGNLVNVTCPSPRPGPTPDTTTNTIYASVTSLSPFVVAKVPFAAHVQQPINSDGSSVFNANRGVIPVKFRLTQDGVATCALPTATIALTRTSGGTTGTIDESVYSGSADTGSNFRISSCQYIYNLSARGLGVGTYRADIKINGTVVGSAAFQLK